MENKVLKVSGMTCQSCVQLIEEGLEETAGIEKVKVSLADNEALVRFDPEKIGWNGVKNKVKELGYGVDGEKAKKKSKGFLQGLFYGLIPHIGCIAFIIASVLGVTVLMNFFKPLLMSRYIFHALIGLSIGFATLSSAFYLRKQKLLSWKGIKRKKAYLSVMYGSTVGINLMLFMLIFPMLANVSIASPTGGAVVEGELSILNLKVDIPCPGHAPLISSELRTIEGVMGIQYSFPENFVVSYDQSKTSKEEMLALEVFKEYPAEVVSEELSGGTVTADQPTAGGCCGSASCGATTGGSCGGGCGG